MSVHLLPASRVALGAITYKLQNMPLHSSGHQCVSGKLVAGGKTSSCLCISEQELHWVLICKSTEALHSSFLRMCSKACHCTATDTSVCLASLRLAA